MIDECAVKRYTGSVMLSIPVRYMEDSRPSRPSLPEHGGRQYALKFARVE
jgi:hypothetical protein